MNKLISDQVQLKSSNVTCVINTSFVTCVLHARDFRYGVYCQSKAERGRLTTSFLLYMATTETIQRTSLSPVQSLPLQSFTPPHSPLHHHPPCLHNLPFHFMMLWLLLRLVYQAVWQSIPSQIFDAIADRSGRGSEEVSRPKWVVYCDWKLLGLRSISSQNFVGFWRHLAAVNRQVATGCWLLQFYTWNRFSSAWRVSAWARSAYDRSDFLKTKLYTISFLSTTKFKLVRCLRFREQKENSPTALGTWDLLPLEILDRFDRLYPCLFIL